MGSQWLRNNPLYEEVKSRAHSASAPVASLTLRNCARRAQVFVPAKQRAELGPNESAKRVEVATSFPDWYERCRFAVFDTLKQRISIRKQGVSRLSKASRTSIACSRSCSNRRFTRKTRVVFQRTTLTLENGRSENLLVAAPTGAGKTNVALMTILREIGYTSKAGLFFNRPANARFVLIHC